GRRYLLMRRSALWHWPQVMAAAMAFGGAQWPEAEGRLLFHEYAPGQEREAPGALAAWRYLLRL
ncbi:MAG: hypothetical protein AAB299_02225, partial [Thermodesulfobacteriota bacterium]